MSSSQQGSSALLDKQNLLSKTITIFTGKNTPKTKKVGIEVELPHLDAETLKPIPFSGPKSISSLFNALAEKKLGWDAKEIENGHIVSMKHVVGNIYLEPGGQIEFASNPCSTLQDLKRAVETYFNDTGAVCLDKGVNVAPYGFHPHLTIDECPYISERSRFAALKAVFEAEGGFAAWGQSSSVQVTLDGGTPENAFARFKAGLMLQPVLAAVFANSPFSQGQDKNCQSWRRQNLLALDSPLYRIPDNLFNPDYTLADWAAYTLTVPMSFVVRDGAYIAVAPLPFQEAVGKPLPELAHLPKEQQYLTETDLLDHLTGIKPEILLKPGLLLECRAADLTPAKEDWLALAAFWTGLFYDETSFSKAQACLQQWTLNDYKTLHAGVAENGLKTALANGKTVQDIAVEILNISKDGLSRVEPAAVSYLDHIIENVAAGQSPADAARKIFNDNDKDISALVKKTFLFKKGA